MKRTPWLKGLWQSMRSTSVRRRSGSTAGIESLEGRQLLSTSALFILSTGELDINLGSSDSVQVNAQSGNAQIKEKAADGSWRCTLPKPEDGKPLTLFAEVTDARGAIVSSVPGPLSSTERPAGTKAVAARPAR